MSRIVSEGLIGKVDSGHTQKMTMQLCGASLALQFAARWQAGVAGIVTSCFGHSNVLAPQIQKLAQIKKHTFYLLILNVYLQTNLLQPFICSHAIYL